MHDQFSFTIVTIVALGVAAQWLAWRFRVPAIVLLAFAGLAAGQLDLINPREVFGSALQPLISLCVAIILFEGGLNLHFRELKTTAVGVRRLIYLGAPLAWAFSSLAAHYVGGLSWPVALVLGAILVVTGPTVIMPMLRQAQLNRRTASYFKWEGIVNDPIGALLAVLVFQFLVYAGEGSGLSAVATGVTLALLSGSILGGVGGWLTGKAFKASLVPEYLKSPVMLGLVLVVFSVSNWLQHDAGLLAVTVMGIVVGNMRLAGINDMKRFKEYITVMLVAVVFVLLTADIELSVFGGGIGWREAAMVGAILFVTRPATVMLATFRSGMERNDRLLLSWIAPRGIVAAATAGVMGPRLVEAGYEDAAVLLPLVFLVIFATVILHGLSISWCARRLSLTSKIRDSVLIVGASPWAVELTRKLVEMNVSVLLVDSSWHNLRPARLAGLPVFYGEILSDFAEESVEISHVGTLLAATSNDAYNALVCTAMAPEIGRGRVFQLPMGGSSEDDPRGMARPLRGGFAFDSEAVFERLWRRHVREWNFYRTRLSENYSYSDFLGDCPAEAIQILLQKPDGTTQLRSPENDREPEEGDTILYYAPKRQREGVEGSEQV